MKMSREKLFKQTIKQRVPIVALSSVRRVRVIFLTITASVGLSMGLARAGVETESNFKPVLHFLRLAFPPEGGAGRISYSTRCVAHDGSFLPFPKVRAKRPAPGQKPPEAVRDIFRADKTVDVTQDRSGVVKITIGKPSTDILQTKIRRLILTPEEQYNAQLAIIAVTKSEEFKSAQHALKVQMAPSVLAASIVEPTKGLPHLPRSLNNMTVDEAFNRIALTFRCAVLYGTCAAQPNRPRMVTFDFAPLYDPLKPPWGHPN